MRLTLNEEITEGVDEVLAWASIFNHHMKVDDLLHNLRVKSSLNELILAIEQSPHLSIEGNVVLSHKYPKNENFDYSQKLASQHLEETKHVLSILKSCKSITGLAVTGSVAAGMNAEGGDVDVLIITKPGWVWRTRALAIFLSHRHPKGRLLCPNMVMSEDALKFEKSVYSAREMMQILPVKDIGGLTELSARNEWTSEFLPNATRKNRMLLPQIKEYPWWWRVMNIPILGRFIESWEASRRIKELTRSSKSSESIYSKSVCRGHENAHKTRIEERYNHVIEAIQ